MNLSPSWLCRLSTFALISLVFAPPASADPGWNLIRQADGVDLWGRSFEGSPFWEYRAETLISQSPDFVWAWILEIRNLPRWMAYVTSARNQTIVFQAPWPFTPEVLEFHFLSAGSAEDYKHLELRGLPAQDNPREQPVVVSFTGELVLKPQSGGTFVQFRLHTELSPRIPPWLANGSLGELPFHSLRQLRDVLAP